MAAARNAAVCAAVMYMCAMVSDTIVMSAGGSALLQGQDLPLTRCFQFHQHLDL